jgi:Flp pilus assembly protein TadG
MLSRLRKMRRRLSHFARRDERGSQFVELAIVLPVLLLFFGAVAEFGRYFYVYSTLAKAARAGARYAISRPLDATHIAEAKSIVAYGDQSAGCAGAPVLPGLDCGNVDIQVATTAGGVQVVTARVSNYPYKPILDLGKLTGITSASLAGNVSTSVTMKYIY